eukprot:6565770-Lingulodinium_polyedra.AAC.1
MTRSRILCVAIVSRFVCTGVARVPAVAISGNGGDGHRVLRSARLANNQPDRPDKRIAIGSSSGVTLR